MKDNMRKLNRTPYFVVLALMGMFYLVANFPKEFSRYWGLVILVTALAALIFSALHKNTIIMVLFGIFVIVQLPPLFSGLVILIYNLNFFGWYLGIGWLGFGAHLAAACWGAFLLIRNIK